jgi:glycosyltransferase involved in cell wall biosynthesis
MDRKDAPQGLDSAEKPNCLDLISIVVPAYNEAAVIVEFNRRLSWVRHKLAFESEVVYVNDGSTDDTLGLLRSIRAADPTIEIVDLSRNFGKEIALTAGIDHAKGDVVIVIDADLQDPPELIPELIERWRTGNDIDVIYGQRASRAGESSVKRLTSYVFYRTINALGARFIPVDTGDFRLLSRRAVDALSAVRERHRFMKGLFAWIGFRQEPMIYERDARYAGTTKWNYWKLWNFSIEGITSFSTAPLKIATYFGLGAAFCAIIYGSFILFKTLFFGNPVPGYPSVVVIILFIGGIQLIFLGIIGEYLARTFDEAKQRPLYFVRERYTGSCARGAIGAPAGAAGSGPAQTDRLPMGAVGAPARPASGLHTTDESRQSCQPVRSEDWELGATDPP